MNYNVVAMMERVAQLIDRTKTARHTDAAYINALNDAMTMIVKDRTAPIRERRNYSVQSAQRIRDELYTLVKNATGSISASAITYPTDYYYYLLVYATIDGADQYCRPTSYGDEGPLLEDPFSKPSTVKPYFNEKSTGLRLFKGSTGTFTTYSLWYLKNTTKMSIGQERNKIVDGGAIANGTTYYVYDQSVYAGATYYPGETFVGSATATLASGTVINAAFIVNCELPDNMHEEVIRLAAAFMDGTVSDFNGKRDLQNDVEKS